MTSSNVPLAVQRAKLLQEVPPFRPVAVKLLNLISDISQPLSRIVNLLCTDAVLTAEVLRLANSPLLGCRYEITSMLQALAYLGAERVNCLVLTTAMRGLVGPMNRKLALACWRHNLATATVCERIAPPLNINPERGYVAGLLHDLGRLALIRAFPAFEEALVQAAIEQRDLLAAERTLYGMDHAEAGQWLLSQWGCPLELQMVAGLHENPRAVSGPERELIYMVSAASRLANLMGFSALAFSQQSEMPEIVELVPKAAGELADFPALATCVATRVNGIELSLG
jgi:HD-like signal output (HDOD) protein